eukprot:gnl/TRDRNA2_/TRDRNA2_190132_c0_seq1.p1 gnl/TRDRNA2_/TRDRNA2_190132_c0~~gnl/TRDRNA2_/TRDRNA2_190132_c0_seq1.p1  ORF type:complete len:276 (-),score=70.93 gnl/TRDRNA2_/TRDRNA2_190132_c0_seq1:192-1019(-)
MVCRMAVLLLALCLQLGAAISAGSGRSALRSTPSARAAAAASFVRSLEFDHRLRICNAYPSSDDLVVSVGSQRITNTSMPYKTCEEFHPNLKAGDKLEFKVGDAGAGTFRMSDLPENDATLVLVIYRHDTKSTAVAFESHVFSNLINAQIAVIDTYRGAEKAVPRIEDAEDAKTSIARSEELRYDSVVAVNPGVYSVVLDEDGVLKGKQELVALNRESYLVLRCGVEAEQDGGQVYPQELMVYPNSDRKVLFGAAAGTSGSLLVMVLAAMFSAFA